MSRFLIVAALSAGLFAFKASALMDDRTSVFKGKPAVVEALPGATVSNQTQQSAIESNEDFDLLNYRYLWNDDAEKARMIINPASKKKEAEDWRPTRKLTAAECTKLMQIMTDRFGEPAKCRNGYASFVYVWRFEGGEWLSVGVCTMANAGGDPIAIFHWDWRKPELSVYNEEEAKAREYPIVQIDKEGLPPAAFFEFFNPYPSIKDGETEKNLITEFNVTKYLEMSGYTRCTAEWDAVDGRYDIYTAHPDEWCHELDSYMGGPHGGHTNEYRVGAVQFYKLASDLFMCYSLFMQDGTLGPDKVRYLFEVYDRDVWSVDSDKPIKSRLVRYLGAMPIDAVPKFREDWINKHGGSKSVAPFSEGRAEQPDGTLLVHGKKSYPDPDDGLGAIWRDVWINLDGEIVRKGEITLRGSDL